MAVIRRQEPNQEGSIFQAYIVPILCVFLIPELSLVGFLWIENALDQRFLASVKEGLGRGTAYGPGPGEKEAFVSLVAKHPASSVLQGDDPRFQSYRNLVDKKEKATFRLVYYCLILSRLLILASLGILVICAIPSFMNRRVLIVNYAVLFVQWNLLRLFILFNIIGQSILVIAFPFAYAEVMLNAMSFRIIAIAAMIAGIPVFHLLKAMVAPLPWPERLNGLELSYSRAPALWHRVAEIANEVQTAAPKNLVLNLSDRFSVADGQVIVQLKEVRGRTLFLSLAIMRVLNRQQVEALIFHQFTYYTGGDTSYVKNVLPLLGRCEAYLDGLKGNLLTFPVFCLLKFFWQSYHDSLTTFNRSRQFRADRLTAERFGSQTVATALILLTAIDQYLSESIRLALSQDEPQPDLDFGCAFRNGFWHYLEDCFLPDDLGRSRWDWNSDSAQSVLERLGALGVDRLPVFQEDYSVTRFEDTWIGAIDRVEELESRLWSRFDENVRQKHEERLAHRYLPATAKEREIVEKFFPPMVFENQAGRELTLTFDSVKFPDRKHEISLGDIQSIKIEKYKKVYYLIIKPWNSNVLFERILIDNYHASREDITRVIQRYLDRNQEVRAWDKRVLNRNDVDPPPRDSGEEDDPMHPASGF